MQHPRRLDPTLLFHPKYSFKLQSVKGATAWTQLVNYLDQTSFPQWRNLAIRDFSTAVRRISFFAVFPDLGVADSPISSHRMSLFFLMTRIYPRPSRELSANIGCHQCCLISIEPQTFQDLSDLCKIMCHLHPAFQKIYWWKLSVLCPSKTVENHLSWLANRDKISNENKRPKTLSNINIDMKCTSTCMHNIYSIKNASLRTVPN